MGSCGFCSTWAKVAFVVLLIALVLDIVGFATISWMKWEQNTQRIKVGLFSMETCIGDNCDTDEVADSYKETNFEAAVVFEVFLLILLCLCVLLVLLYLLVDSFKVTCVAWAAIIMCLLAFMCGIIGMICWLVYVDDPYVVGFSLGLTVLAAILALIAGFLLLPDVIERQPRQPHQPHQPHQPQAPRRPRPESTPVWEMYNR